MAISRQGATFDVMGAFFRSTVMQPVADAWLEVGGTPSDIMGGLAVSPVTLLDPRAWMPRGACFRLVNELSSCCGDSLIGLHLADKVDWRLLGRWAEGIVSASTIGRALDRAAGKLHLLQSSSRLQLMNAGGMACLRFDYAPPFEDRPDQFLLADILSLTRIFRLAAEPIRVSIRTIVQKPREVDEVMHLLGPDIRFGASANELIFEASALGMPLQSGAAGLAMQPDDLDDKRMTGRQVASAIGRWLEYEPLTVSLIARHLGMNVRTVQRHLSLWGVSFEALLDQYRRQHALELLHEPEYSVTDAAFRLGYSDAAHFTRAFKRWYGVPPSGYAQVPFRPPPPASLPADF